MAIFENSLFTTDDFLQIENVLYTPREEEMIARRLLRLNTSYASFAREIGYDFYQREGSAIILASGGSAKDIPFVGEKGGRVTQKVYDIVTGVRWTKAERKAIQAKRSLGKGPSVQLDTIRVKTARRYIFEKENDLTFVGNSDYGIKGILDSSFFGTDLGTIANVAASGTGATPAEKRLWTNKTPAQILTDIQAGINIVEFDGLFKARVLVLPPDKFNQLQRPYSDASTHTVLAWIKSNLDLEGIIKSRTMRAPTNGDNVNYMMLLDNDPEIIEMVITEDINIGNPIFDIIDTMEQAVIESYGGVIFRHPSGVYVGKGI